MSNILTNLPAHFRTSETPKSFNEGFIKAINALALSVDQTIELAGKQLFISTADGKYLLKLGEQEGFVLPVNSGLDINAVRQLVPAVISSPKQVIDSITKLIEVFYGQERTRANIYCATNEPYSLRDGDDLVIETVSGIETIAFKANQMSDITNLSTAELAAYINSLQNTVLADIHEDIQTGLKYLKLTSKVWGFSSFIRVVGGTAQNIFKFPQLTGSAVEANLAFTLTKVATYSNALRVTWSGIGTNPNLFLSRKDDTITIRGITGGAVEDTVVISSGSPVILEVLNFTPVENSIFTLSTTGVLPIGLAINTPYYIKNVNGNSFEVSLTPGGVSINTSGPQSGVHTYNPVMLDGSYKVVDVGYDYFIIYNDQTPFTSMAIIAADANIFEFTSNNKNILYNQEEYAYASQIGHNRVLVTVPAVPPLARRYLEGSAHLHHAAMKVDSFTRSQIKLDISDVDGDVFLPNDIVLANDYSRPDFRQHMRYHLTSNDSLSPIRGYSLDITDEDYSILPYTVNTPVGTNVIRGEINSENYKLTFPYRHGLRDGWGFNLTTTVGAGNVTTGLLNTEQVVSKVVDNYTIEFRVRGTDKLWVKYSGTALGTIDIVRYAALTAQGADFHLDFALGGVVACGIQVGDIVKINIGGGVNVHPWWGGEIRGKKCVVKAISGDIVDVEFGYGAGSEGTIITGIDGVRSGLFGGSVSYYCNQLSTFNSIRHFGSDLTAHFLGAPQSSNPEYVGSYLYDPTGSVIPYTVSSVRTNLTTAALRGDSPVALFVDSVQDFPSTGSVIINYGTSKYEGPVPYIAIISATSGSSQILIKPSYKFRYTHAVGSLVQVVSSNVAYKPGTDGSDYPAYLTGTAQARQTLYNLLLDIVACGIFIDFNVLYPDLRYADQSINPFE